jgi:hypothetical protein
VRTITVTANRLEYHVPVMRALAALFAPLFVAAAASTAFAAGDVVATLSATGELDLTGDDLANDVAVTRDPTTKEFLVLGRNGTTVNGGTEFRTLGVKSIRAVMNGGDDVLAVAGLRLKKNLYADMGEGNNSLDLYHVIVGGRVNVYGGAGDDTIKVEAGCDLLGGGLANAGDGVNHVAVTDSTVRGRLRILTGGGDDLVEIHHDGFTSDASLSIRTGAGNDTVDYLGCTFQCPVETLTGAGTDTINIMTSRFERAVGMNTGDDDDNVEVERSTFDARFFVSGGHGTNNVYFVGINIGINGSNVTAGGAGHSGHWYWAFIIVHVFP